MLFTVFQYVPILEEDIHASKTLDKKADDSSNEKDSTDSDDSGDDENDSDEFFNDHGYGSLKLFASGSKFNTFQETYYCLVSGTTTPPPKI